MIKFEIHKALKNRSIYIVIFIALLLTGYGNFVNTQSFLSYHSIEYGVSSYTLLDEVMADQNFYTEYDFVNKEYILIGAPHELSEQYSELAKQLPKFDPFNQEIYDTDYPVLSSEFSYGILDLIQQHNLTVNSYSRMMFSTQLMRMSI